MRQARDFSLRTDLQAADRDLILRLKTEARQRTNYYGTIVTSWDIYQFCIAKGGDSLSALEMWKPKAIACRLKPGRLLCPHTSAPPAASATSKPTCRATRA